MLQNAIMRLLILAITIVLWSDTSFAAEEAYIEVAFFNVGQGSCTAIKALDKKNVWIINAGSKKNPINITDNQSFSHKNMSTCYFKMGRRS